MHGIACFGSASTILTLRTTIPCRIWSALGNEWLYVALIIAIVLGAVLVLGGMVTLPLALRVHNDLVRRSERLRALLDRARRIRDYRRAVRAVVRWHLGRSRKPIAETSNGAWFRQAAPNSLAMGVEGVFRQDVTSFPRAIDAELEACALETEAQLALRREAAEYNSRLRSFPCCLLARLFGFRPWSTRGPIEGCGRRCDQSHQRQGVQAEPGHWVTGSTHPQHWPRFSESGDPSHATCEPSHCKGRGGGAAGRSRTERR